ncbi:putative ABC transporter ATP-binding protein YbhF [Rhodobacteraceae bacterium THAF1]|uniref:ABC transporter ATP-binding protein n=1 Tax=Palleronia sp. THAF1 TaxID=2587842 RepID=UPI000F3E2EAE|nr:ABC transporter ATP-binding protein [Palleronia sp. THAF1]QFU09116.1 putative ABC transporter ATP-binding protein YbhF [Palleronia sp. THAF1]VDC24076.1 putative ABC transporter ATP-binding protein YbhF [Rhodobacteraceae bacterium THAF1]
MTGLRVDDLSFAYGAKQALDKVSLRAKPGSFTALLGPNGAGKSTLFALLTRLFTTRNGSIHIAGHDLQRAPLKALGALGVVFQQSTLDLDLTVQQNLAYFAALHGLTPIAAKPRIAASLDRLGMAERAHEKVRALNGGHRRRAEIARALLHDPKVLLCDEPTVGLDAAARAAITDHVHALAASGICVLWATHLTDEVRPDDHLIILHQGRILRDGTTKEIAADQPLSDTFLSLTAAPA